ESLRRAETATFATRQRVPAILRPGDRREVQACLRVAGRHGVAVYPVSGGRNWGLGSRVPPLDGCALVDLGRMDRILDYDEELAYVTVEPGVTFRRLYDFLRQHASSLFLNTIGGSPEASVVADALERGAGWRSLRPRGRPRGGPSHRGVPPHRVRPFRLRAPRTAASLGRGPGPRRPVQSVQPRAGHAHDRVARAPTPVAARRALQRAG